MATQPPQSEFCQLVLIAPENISPSAFIAALGRAFNGGAVASLILPQYGMDEVAFQRLAEQAGAIAQAAGAALIIAGDTRVAGRVGADGLHVEGATALTEAIEKYQSRIAVGGGGVKTRDDALELGELRPDYIFFGKFGFDNKPETHPRNLGLAQWWAEMIEIPCILMAGSSIESVAEAARTGAEFVAVSRAVFYAADPAAMVARAVAILADLPLPTEAAG
jgi:thiamine-phosphate pyrophosphorylase